MMYSKMCRRTLFAVCGGALLPPSIGDMSAQDIKGNAEDESAQSSVVVVKNGPPTNLGRGCNIVKSIANRSLVWSPVGIGGVARESPAQQGRDATCRIVETREQLTEEYERSFGVGGQGEYDGVVLTGSQNRYDIRRLTINSSTKYAFITCFYPILTRTFDPQKAFGELLTKSRGISEVDFIERHGDSFLIEETLGSYLRFVYKFQSHNSSEMEEFRNAVNGRLSAGNNNVNAAEAYSKRISRFRSNIVEEAFASSSEGPPPQTIEAAFVLWDALASKPGKLMVLSGRTMRYSHLRSSNSLMVAVRVKQTNVLQSIFLHRQSRHNLEALKHRLEMFMAEPERWGLSAAMLDERMQEVTKVLIPLRQDGFRKEQSQESTEWRSIEDSVVDNLAKSLPNIPDLPKNLVVEIQDRDNQIKEGRVGESIPNLLTKGFRIRWDETSKPAYSKLLRFAYTISVAIKDEGPKFDASLNQASADSPNWAARPADRVWNTMGIDGLQITPTGSAAAAFDFAISVKNGEWTDFGPDTWIFNPNSFTHLRVLVKMKESFRTIATDEVYSHLETEMAHWK